MLLANYTQANRNTGQFVGSPFTNPAMQFRPMVMACFTFSEGLARAALPHGYANGVAFALAKSSGGIASTTQIEGEGGISASALAVRLAEAGLTGAGDLAALGSLVVQAIAAITGSGGVTSANLQAFLQAVAAISGSGGAAGALAGLGAAVASLTGSGTAAGSTLTGTGELEAAITVTGSGLSTANVAEAVWSALASASNAAGTMGEKLNDAGSASNPWTEVIESGYTAAEILRLLAAVAQGDATGLENGSPIFKGIDGTTDRVTATYENGTRTITARDAS
ncbi:MAG: hypothetical protein RJA36_1357 [Pseudomonadota bacterium]